MAVPAVMLEDVPRDIVFKSLKVSGVCAPVCVCVCVCVCVSVCVITHMFVRMCICIL